ncbi:MAG: nucleotidyltransferase family protein [Ruminococcus sp.]|nr:nucleotidyltransferase family protein [Ruminococcus sp.]
MAVAVICEFNPFHNGHKYILNKAKMIADEPIIAIMSGSFTQRGEVAVTDKFTRAKIALQNGADLVVEMPVFGAIACAERFAKVGVSLAKAFECVNYLAFGCESDDIDCLYELVQAKDNARVNEIIKKKMGEGDYYPRAFESAVSELYGNKTASVLKGANNILGVEYISCLRGTDIKPLPIKRIAVEHDSDIVNMEYASASYIRKRIRNGKKADEYMPYADFEITYPSNLESAVLYKLRSMTADDFKILPEVSEGLENRITEAVKQNVTVDGIIDFIKTKRYTRARIQRIIAAAFVGVCDDLQRNEAMYVRVLGFSKVGATLLKGCRLPVVTSVAKAINSLDETAQKSLTLDILSTDIASLAFDERKKTGADYTTPVIKV